MTACIREGCDQKATHDVLCSQRAPVLDTEGRPTFHAKTGEPITEPAPARVIEGSYECQRHARSSADHTTAQEVRRAS